MDQPNYKPRAIAVMVALRNGPLTTRQLQNCLSDPSMSATRKLMADMLTDVVDHRLGDPNLWYLTDDGVGWIESQGLDVASGARR
jgi:hypothetical protein